MSGTRPSQGAGRLYLVATPIGNLEDMTYRAVRLLKEVDLIAAEDTRHSRRLLAHYGIETALISYHEHNEQQRETGLLARLQEGRSIALISDAGTPAIADPGYRLVQACSRAGITVVPVPGPSALVAALSASGLPTDRFAFEGYLPARAKARADVLDRLSGENRTLIFYEAPHRLEKALADIVRLMGGERSLVIARELTKLHEELYRGTAAEALEHFRRKPARGELVLMLAPVEIAPQVSVAEALRDLFAAGELSRREIVKLVAREYGLAQSEVYRESLKFGRSEVADDGKDQDFTDR